jgi:glycerophosphoryl diester phosphodiesterase
MSTSKANDPTWDLTIYAHRGLWAWNFPENSIEAFREAQRHGFPSECDVWMSRDGEPVVIHDETLARTTLGSGRVTDFTADELRKIPTQIPGFGASFSPLPTLRDVCDLVYAVEIKPWNAPELVRRTVSIMAGRQWLLQSFDVANLQIALQMDPNVSVALLVEDESAIEQAIENHWTVHVDHRLLDDRIVGRLRDAGLNIGVWTVNTEEEIYRVFQWRPEVVISDFPPLVRVMARRSGITCT